MINQFINKIYNKIYNKINKKSNLFFIIFIILVILIILCILNVSIDNTNNESKSKSKSKSNFYDIIADAVNKIKNPSTTVTPTTTKFKPTPEAVYGKDGTPAPPEYKSCDAGNDVVGTCLNYDNCCSGSAKSNCLCTSPIVLSCNDEYKACMADPKIPSPTLLETCGDKIKTCCSAYNYNSDSTKFNPPLDREQKDNVLCSISNISNIEPKCKELCQMNPNCVALTVNPISCVLHNNVSPYQKVIDPVTKKEVLNHKADFFIKK